MAVTIKWYGNAVKAMMNKEIDLDSDTIKVMLCTSSYTPDQDAHDYKDDVTNEITGTGYSAGGVTLTGVAVTYNSGTNTVKFDANDAAWAGATFTARYAIVYDSTPGSDATRPLLLYVDFGADVSVTSSTFTITWDTTGIGTAVVA